MNSEARNKLNLLEALEQDGRVTQRGLAAKLGMALGLTNLYLKRLVRKGYIKCVNVQSNRLLYLITPSGIAEKTRLTYEYMEYSLRLYGEARQRLRALLEPHVADGRTRIAIYGTGEAAELAYLCIRAFGLEPVAIFSTEEGGSFVGMPVTSVSVYEAFAFDILVVATLDDPAILLKTLQGYGISARKLVPLRQVPSRDLDEVSRGRIRQGDLR
jgi:DNA-binding MarR family transcriptional regulator